MIIQVVDEQTGSVMDLSQASNFQFLLKPPGQTAYTVGASLYADGRDGKIVYTTQTTDLTLKGVWKLQGIYTLSGSKKYTSVGTFEVLSNLND